jgi:membrane dipeptidase
MYCSCAAPHRSAAPHSFASSQRLTASGSFASPAPRASDDRDDETYPGPAESHVWMDAHAHPGRCFLADLPSSDLFVQLMGAADIDGAIADMKAGGLGVVAFSTVGDMRVLAVKDEAIYAGRDFDPGEAAADHRRQLAAVTRIANAGGCTIVRRAADLLAHDAGGLRVVVSCEGADFLEGQLDGVEQAYTDGARSITLVHYRVNELGDIQTEAPRHGGLTAFGKEVVQEMNRLGMVVDLAHATWDVTRDVLDISTVPVVISHSHLASGPDAHPRLLSRDHALAIVQSGGVVAAWPSGVALTTFDDYIDEVLRMIDLLGVDHVAIGTDMDANYHPVLTNYRQFPRLADAISRRGVTPEESKKVLGGNLLRLYGQVLG